MKYSEMNRSMLQQELDAMRKQYEAFRMMDLKLNMTRGKPCSEQLEICNRMQELPADFRCSDGSDARNYGTVDGIPEAKRLFSQILEMPQEQIIIGGSASLSLMYDAVCRAYLHGVNEKCEPWFRQGTVKFLCPSPGYDRHFAITQSLGFELIPVEMKEDGPDMDQVEKLVADDPAVKGIWCVPMYSNPAGITYSDEVVRRFAAMETAAPDFRIFWDNAYCVHHLDLKHKDHLLNLYQECAARGNEDRVYIFTSTSKVTVAGSGLSAMAMSPANCAWMLKHMSIQYICNNTVNQLRHARFLPDMAAVDAVMEQHAAIIRPKFRMVLDHLEKEIAPLDIACWNDPHGGYFISFFSMPGCAKRIVSLCKDAGLQLTAAGATYPYGIDPKDSNIRIAPTYPGLEELQQAAELFCVAVRIAALEKLLAE